MAEYRAALRAFLEERAAGEGSGSAGSYLYPNEFLPELATQLAEYGVIFGDMTRVQTDNGRNEFFPTRNTGSVGTLQGGDGTQVNSVDAVFGQGTFEAYTITSGAQRISFQLEADASSIPIEDVVHDFAVESIGRGLSAYSVTGTGTGQPLGINTALNTQGTAGTVGSPIAATGGFVVLSAARALEINGSASTELAHLFPGPMSLLSMIQAVDPAYHPGAKWYMTVGQFTTACTITDTVGQPLIRPSGPMSLYGFPIVIANELPTGAASTTGGPIFGNLAKAFYWRDAGMSIQRTTELHGDFLQTSVIAYGRYDLEVRDIRAACTVKFAAT